MYRGADDTYYIPDVHPLATLKSMWLCSDTYFQRSARGIEYYVSGGNSVCFALGAQITHFTTDFI